MTQYFSSGVGLTTDLSSPLLNTAVGLWKALGCCKDFSGEGKSFVNSSFTKLKILTTKIFTLNIVDIGTLRLWGTVMICKSIGKFWIFEQSKFRL